MVRANVWHPIDAHIGARLRARRKEIGLNQQGLAQLIGMTFQQMQKYETGRNRIHISKLFEIAIKLNVDIGYFYEGYDEPVVMEAGAPNAAFEFLMTDEGQDLARTFARIKHAGMRRKVVELTKMYLDAQDEASRR